jgi:uncharacterized membrane protein
MVPFFVQTWKMARYLVEASLMATGATLALVMVLWVLSGVVALVSGWETAAPVMAATFLSIVVSMLFLIAVPMNLALMFVCGSVARNLTK